MTQQDIHTECSPSSDADSFAAVHFICLSQEILDGEDGVGFDVAYMGQTCRAFAVRFQGRVFAYINRCKHVAIELDYVPNQFFDASGQWLLCATHGAIYDPQSGACAGGPCRSSLISIRTSECDGHVYWHTAYNLKPVDNSFYEP